MSDYCCAFSCDIEAPQCSVEGFECSSCSYYCDCGACVHAQDCSNSPYYSEDVING